MRRAFRWLLFVLPAVVCAGPPRFARVSEFQGEVQVQVHVADLWQPALRNLPLVESSRISSDASSRVEIELDEASSLRLVGDALSEISDYSQLSTGQRITLISIDHGTAYFSGQPRENDSLGVAAPGAQIVLRRASRVRFEVSDHATQIAILEGAVRFSTPTAEIELHAGQMVALDPANRARFQLLREIPELDSDKWPDTRASELEHAGNWLQTDEAGLVWKPKAAPEWTPFQSGVWRWYEELGYTWVAAEPWGWKPYHFGRWLQHSSLGWVWSQSGSPVFKPGEVYWMRGSNFAGWGPLAPGEDWTGAPPPRQFAALNTTLARFNPGLREFAPAADLPKPKDLLAAASFAIALPSPPMFASRLDAVRAPLRSVGAKLISFAPDAVTIPGASYDEHPPAPSAPPPSVITKTRTVVQPVYVEPEEPVEIYYPFPVYSGFVILNPPGSRPPVKADKNKTLHYGGS